MPEANEFYKSSTNSINSLFSLNRYSRATSCSVLEEQTQTTSSNTNTNNEVGQIFLDSIPQLSPIDVDNKNKFVIILVGLPATGKSTIASHLIHYLKKQQSSRHLRCTVFNAGSVRRTMCKKNLVDELFNQKHSNLKEEFAKITLHNLLESIDNDECDIAIFDATNSNLKRREYVVQELDAYNQNSNTFTIIPMILQITCHNRDFIRYNIHNKSFNEDYFDKSYKFAITSFSNRVKNYYSQFHEMDEEELNKYSNLPNIDNFFIFKL
ncbi:hypothetical protein TPHA_0A00390 [Tetrapisispora phaffii CBS 4417]|uniref:6-phosphofructo-2-kinase domain-containing protein n=1 Tax=Tetrapisispora phaffii (strain ATCC 24235 / CBS 4417 / NBRC 1672 / NRRL Y-8282 / UCD 70-5) TaxID=1071381 RepID=G8BMJ6_TETPH|nr:hypothetical protein TPHA_0A00390 [Tetrapisispora phaffii CBS 4417]CCE61124.1 hypothetical protein TPHA_0A00390 [Tetrapisispora phaffii CBS 4417]